VFERITRSGIESGVFANVDAKLFALDALFLCHLWSLHTRALRSITQDVDQFFNMQCEMLLNGVLSRKPAAAVMKKRAARGAV
jgi:hypothetical protein